MPFKVLFVTTNDWVPWGGSEVLWSSVALQLARSSSDFSLSTYVKEWSPVPAHIEKLAQSGVEVIYKRKTHLPFYQRIVNRILPSRMRFALKEVYNGIVEKPWNLIVFSLGDHNDGIDLIATCRKKKIPYVIIVQLAKEAVIPADGIHADEIRENYIGALRAYFVSHGNREIIKAQIAHPLPAAEVVSNPFPVLINAIPYPRSTGPFEIAFVASLSANHKGHDLLFQVLAKKKWQARNLQINLYGKGPHHDYLHRLKAFYHLTSVHFKGFSSTVSEIWQHNHAALLCSRMEGQSLALLEAMSYSRMPIVTDVGDASVLIEDGVNGFIAEAATVRHLDEALERAWIKREQWENMGKLAGEKLRSLRPGDPVSELAQKISELLKTGPIRL